MSTAKSVLSTFALGRGPWKTFDPFLFCVHHLDEFPVGNADMAPDPKLLRNREIGSDFSYQDGWSMYHGDTIPGFPNHPHRGFETITSTRRGLVDHSDSFGATARYGSGDVQWMTAGSGIQHAEMFPLVNRDKPNTMELFQIWLNLPKASKMVPAYFTMFWADKVPLVTLDDGRVKIRVVAGSAEYFPQAAPATPCAPPPDSWASRADADVAIWEIDIAAGGTVTLPPARDPNVNRAIYIFSGDGVRVGEGSELKARHGAKVDPSQSLQLTATKATGVLVLQGRPIGEPVAQYGPFVMNTNEEIQQAFSDYRRTQFGGWPWKSSDPVHPASETRFAKHINGTLERPRQ